jgi:hypothetical protein
MSLQDHIFTLWLLQQNVIGKTCVLLSWNLECVWQDSKKLFNFRNLLYSLLKLVKRWPIISIIHVLCSKLVHNIYSKNCTATNKYQNVKSQIWNFTKICTVGVTIFHEPERRESNMQKVIVHNSNAMCLKTFSTYQS